MPIERKKYLFIIGAGASAEAGLPTGMQLIELIKNDLDFNQVSTSDGKSPGSLIYRALKEHIRETKEGFTPYRGAALNISHAMALTRSIDTFLHCHQENKEIQLCGKLAIVSRILERERSSEVLHALNDPEKQDFPIHTWWYYKFFRMLIGTSSVPELPDRLRSIGLVVFNYDRCVEHFLYFALQKYYASQINSRKAAELVSLIDIFHPYGTVGKLTWQDSKNGVQFGGVVEPGALLRLAGGIRTYGEKAEQGTEESTFSRCQHQVQDAVKTAESFVFLGFGFLDDNMTYMTPEYGREGNPGGRHVYGTAPGVSQPNLDAFRIKIAQVTRSDITNRIHLEDQSCGSLFDHYSEVLKITS